jgi:hypothetical protein
MNSSYESDAMTLRNAVKGAGTDEGTIIKITSQRNSNQRQLIRQTYKSSFGRDLVDDLEDELSGNLKRTIVGMYLSPVEFDVYELNEAFEGAGSDEDSISEIIGSRNNKRLQEIKALYKQKFGETIESRIKDETSGNYEKLLIALLQCGRNESNDVSRADIEKDVTDLYKAGEGKWGTDEETFVRIFCLRSAAHLACVNMLYQQKHGKSLLDVVDSEFTGDVKVLLKTILHSHINASEYFADRIFKACKGAGTNDKALIRSLIVTDENMLSQIKNIYAKKYGKTLEDEIKNETSGDYCLMLLGLVSS